MANRYGIAVVGLGRIAIAHLEAISALADRCRLRAVVTRRGERGREISEKYGAERVYDSLDRCLLNPAVDAVVICLPNDMHTDAVLDAVSAGKHVLVEKPLANTTADADRLVQAATSKDVRLMVGQCRRFFLPVMEAVRRRGEVGRILNVVSLFMGYFERAAADWWRDLGRTGGGLVIDLVGPHALDFILWLLDETPEAVFAETRNHNPDWPGEDEATITLRFESGTLATVHLSYNSRPAVNARFVIGTEGSMVLRGENELWLNGKRVQEETGGVDYLKGGVEFVRQLAEFLDAIRDGREPCASGREVRRVIQTLEAAKRSARSKAVVRLGPDETPSARRSERPWPR